MEGISGSSCILSQSHQTSGVRTIAKLLENGGVCGIPTDTVYALAASCKHPDAIKRIYTIKERPTEKPVCICISNLDQLRVINPPFSPLLWRRLSDKLDAVLCDGTSNEVVGSTVVNCLKIDEGIVTILREGCVSSTKIMQLFEVAKTMEDMM
ncbi:tRNA threonylcarbamoyladenosine biosynthesis [Pelobates cultripes]|uniref:Threonylcarbamoyl-AMP synthase n=1 Tax=Pelobates cultripes TaxID=61616 RepID=A0AAD1WNT1_PELCU|nr:tRNA threonylcarbamoyladenosine biosynthesis [Pelobates cultripes]